VIRRFIVIVCLLIAVTAVCGVDASAADSEARSEKKKAKKSTKEPKSGPTYEPFSDKAVGFRGVGEVWQEAAIVMVHRSSRFGGTGFFSAGITELFGMEIEIGYNRLVGTAVNPVTNQRTDNQATLELVPIAMDGTMRMEGSTSDLVFGAGPAFVSFNDRSPTNAISGMKIGIDVRVAVQIHTHFIQHSIRPGARGMRRMDLEFLIGRRQHQAFGIGEGLDLSAWRIGLGLVGRL
jgi:hypothetical protein